jgi:hypothetical protein
MFEPCSLRRVCAAEAAAAHLGANVVEMNVSGDGKSGQVDAMDWRVQRLIGREPRASRLRHGTAYRTGLVHGGAAASLPALVSPLRP